MKLAHRTTIVAALAALTLLAGCGGSDDSGSDGGSDGGGEESSAAADDGFADQSGDEIADAAKADMLELDQVRYAGTITSDGSDISLDIQASSTGDCMGTIGIGDGTAELVSKDGSSWFRPDEAFWRSSSPDTADQIIAAVGDKWVLDTDDNFTQFCDIDEFFASIFDDSDDSGDGEGGSYETTGTDTLDGADVVTVERTTDNGSSTGYVLADSPHYLVKIERTEGDEPGAVEFSGFDEEFDVTAPTEDEVVDLSQL